MDPIAFWGRAWCSVWDEKSFLGMKMKRDWRRCWLNRHNCTEDWNMYVFSVVEVLTLANNIHTYDIFVSISSLRCTSTCLEIFHLDDVNCEKGVIRSSTCDMIRMRCQPLNTRTWPRNLKPKVGRLEARCFWICHKDVSMLRKQRRKQKPVAILSNVGKTTNKPSPVFTFLISGNFYHSQSWVVYGIVFPKLLWTKGLLTKTKAPTNYANTGAENLHSHAGSKDAFYIYFILHAHIWPCYHFNWGWFHVRHSQVEPWSTRALTAGVTSRKRKLGLEWTGLGIDVPFGGFVSHHQNSHICWRWNSPHSWVMWNIGTLMNSFLKH